MENEKRRHPRLECEGQAEFFCKPGAKGSVAKVLDLAVAGCQIVLESEEDVSMGAFVEVSFTVRGLVFRVRGQVKVKRSPTVIGLQFDRMSERLRGQMEELIEELTEETKRCNVNKEITGEGRITPKTIPLDLDLQSMGRR